MAKIIIDAETRELFEKFYGLHTAGVTSDEKELAIAQDLLRRGRAGAVPDDKGENFVVIDLKRQVSLDNPLLTSAAAQKVRSEGLRKAIPLIALLIIGLVIVFLTTGGKKDAGESGALTGTPGTPIVTGTLTVAVSPTPTEYGAPTLTPSLTPSTTPSPTPSPPPSLTPAPGDTPIPTNTPLPTETYTPTPTTIPSPTPEFSPQELGLKDLMGTGSSTGNYIHSWPTSLEIQERHYPVAVTSLDGRGEWGFAAEPDRASWLFQTNVNVVIGLPDTPPNVALFLAAQPGHLVLVRDNHGVVHQFTIDAIRVVDQYQVETFRQKQAALTLVLLQYDANAPGQRVVIKALPGELVGTATELDTAPTPTLTPLPTSTPLPTPTTTLTETLRGGLGHTEHIDMLPTSPPLITTSCFTYTVHTGDTLSRLATTYSTTVAAIAAGNQLTYPYPIVVSQPLVICPP